MDFNPKDPTGTISELDAKKKGYSVPKILKLALKNQKDEDLLPV